MANAAPTGNHGSCNTPTRVGTTVEFSKLNQAGCYVFNWSGQLMRVPEEAAAPGGAPVVDIIGSKPLLVTKISDDPFVPLTEARLLACNFDLHVTF